MTDRREPPRPSADAARENRVGRQRPGRLGPLIRIDPQQPAPTSPLVGRLRLPQPIRPGSKLEIGVYDRSDEIVR